MGSSMLPAPCLCCVPARPRSPSSPPCAPPLVDPGLPSSQVCAMDKISSSCALGMFVGMSEQKEKQYICVQQFDPASHEFPIFFCATVRPRCLWQSHEEECGIRIMKSSSWFPSEFPWLKVGFHVEVWNAIDMEILMEYDDGDVVLVDLIGRAGSGGRWMRMHELWGSICRLDSDHRFLPLHPTRHASDPAAARSCCSILRLPGDAATC